MHPKPVLLTTILAALALVVLSQVDAPPAASAQTATAETRYQLDAELEVVEVRQALTGQRHNFELALDTLRFRFQFYKHRSNVDSTFGSRADCRKNVRYLRQRLHPLFDVLKNSSCAMNGPSQRRFDLDVELGFVLRGYKLLADQGDDQQASHENACRAKQHNNPV